MSEELARQEAGITIDEQIRQALKRMPVTDARIHALKDKYQGLKTNGVDDKESYEAVYSAHQTVIKVRTSIEASRKILKADALKFGRAVDAEAERLTNMALPIEDHLYQQRMVVDNEVARIKALKEAEEQEKYQGRAFKLAQLGMSFDGNIYKRRDIVIVALNLKRLSDGDFEIVLKSVQEDYNKEQAEIAEEARLKKEEEDRLAAEKIEADRKDQKRRAEEDRLRKIENARLAAERAEIEKIKKEQAEKEAAIKAAQDKIDAETKAIEDRKRKETDEKRHAEEIETAKKEAAEQARKNEQARVERDARVREENARLAAIEAEEKKAQMSDKEKLRELFNTVDVLLIPEFKSKKAKAAGLRVGHLLKEICDVLEGAL